jgi:hypothetical protein
MSKDKKPCSSCSNILTLLPSVKDAINKFIKNSQTIIAKFEQHFNSQNDRYKMTSYLKTKPIKGKTTSVELFILQVISKYDVNTKKFVLFNWFKAPSQTTTETESEIMLKFFNNPTNYFDLKLVMFTIGKLISLGKTEKSKAPLKSSTNCCSSSNSKNDCYGTSQQQLQSYKQADGSTNYKCECVFTGKITCYSGDNGCNKTNNCNPDPAPVGMVYLGQTPTPTY